MKVDTNQIIRDHIATLRDDRSGRTSKADILTFYLVPVLTGCAAYWMRFKVSGDVYNVSITFFGIFVALLLNLQVAAFGVFQRKWDVPSDQNLKEAQERTLKIRRNLLGQINANVSYLVLISCGAIVLFLVFFAMHWKCGLAPAIGVIVYCHFLLTLLMVVKRSHAIFRREYEG